MLSDLVDWADRVSKVIGHIMEIHVISDKKTQSCEMKGANVFQIIHIENNLAI